MQEKNKQELVLMKVFDNEPFEGYVDTSLEETEEDEERVQEIFDRFMKLWVLKNQGKYIQEN